MTDDTQWFCFQWVRTAPDKDDFLATFAGDNGVLARIYREESGADPATWIWQISLAGRQIGAGRAVDPRAAARAAEDAYFAVCAPGDGGERRALSG